MYKIGILQHMSPELSVKKSSRAYNFLHILYFPRATPNGGAGAIKNPRLLRAGEIISYFA